MSFQSVALLSFWTVFLAELVGDKSIYIVSSLSLRYRPMVVFLAITMAFASKTLAVVLLARMLVRFHSHWIGVLSAIAFFISALVIWFREPEAVPEERPANAAWWKAAAICYAALFCTEWGDPGQIALAALTMKFNSILASWLGGTLAMTVKGGLAITLGLTLRKSFPELMVRTLASVSCFLLGIVALGGVFSH